MVFVSAFCLEPGESVASVNDAKAGSQAGKDDIRQVGDYLVIDPEVARNAFYHDCTPDEATNAAGVSHRSTLARGWRSSRTPRGAQCPRTSSCAPWTGHARRRSSG
ncbi:hypothetical protein SVIO_111660 [Streptomyces violaceusniger]|uniref:Uncharacterized protein n=1 Tax=Streptomyces violaceusniger TaxID=68280 RepID=A0A4D4LR33_STRVO|nr:hypothetical protein SVIO_111660 [Streptomyces violaceusniger]